ncbi:YbaB/EbfC family nucleoid-associated protein [Lentzea sp. E54]|uniref:YbaB/EbfC family nucleoid-associated protein n=1 Tax=Lentzea xerophila TaxID=3435883 RepID=UPI003DA3F3DD
MRDLKQRTDGLRDAQAAIAAMSGVASSPDGNVVVTVDSTGVLDKLELGPRAFERVTPEQLAQTITQVSRRAARNVREQVDAHMAPLTSEEGTIDLPDIVPGAPSIKDIFKVEQRDEPAVPPPPSDEDFGSSVLRKEVRPVQRATTTGEDEDFGGNSIMGRGNGW